MNQVYINCAKSFRKKWNSRTFQDFSDFSVLFKADLIFKDFQESSLNSSTFQACANPGNKAFKSNSLVLVET